MTNLICHRGASKYAPQNTIPAFLKAVELKADGVEFDVHLTKDKELVVCHDYNIKETSNGRGRIKDYTLKELKQFDFGINFSPEFKNTQIPTLKEVLDIVKDFKIINIELKSQDELNEELAKRVINEVKLYSFTGDVVFSSFDLELVKTIKSADNTLKVGALFSPSDFSRESKINKSIDFVKQNNFQTIHPHMRNIKKNHVNKCHENGVMVNVWGANSYDGIKRMLDIGCDSIITDEIALAMQICGR